MTSDILVSGNKSINCIPYRNIMEGDEERRDGRRSNVEKQKG